MTKEQIEKLDKLRYRISRLHNLISSLNGKNGYCDISMDKEDKEYLLKYAGAKIEELNKEFDLI